MAVKIITDTLSDISDDLAAEHGITVIPLYVRFGEEVYRDRVEITAEEFYRRLQSEDVLPSTTQPTPNDFSAIYEKLAEETDEILVIVISSKMSGTYRSAEQARESFEGKCRIEIIDSLSVAMPQGLIAISAAKAVQAGAGLDEAARIARDAIDRTHLAAYFDTLKYLAKGGRIGKAQGLLGSMLSVKPILTIKEGEMAPLTRVRSLNAGMDYLFNVVSGMSNIEALAVEHTTTPDIADELTERIGTIYPKEKIYRSIISPVIGVYAGPKAVAVSILESGK